MEQRAKGGQPLAVPVKQPPSKAMLDAAKAKAKREGVSLPKGAVGDASICRAFLGPRQEGTGPSEAQLKFAREVAQALGVQLPEELLADRHRLSAWIDQHKDQVPRKAVDDQPTSKQVELAEKIAAAKGVDIPPETLRSRSSLSKWIDAHNDKVSKGARAAGTGRSRRKGSDKE